MLQIIFHVPHGFVNFKYHGKQLERLPLHTILMELLKRPEFKTSTACTAIIHNAEALVHFLIENPNTCFKTYDVAFKACTQTLMSEIVTMGRKSNGWHFSAQKASSKQIEGFLITDMSRDLQVHTPQLWHVLSAMLVSNPTCESQQAHYQQTR
jgi:hypothetical protein